MEPKMQDVLCPNKWLQIWAETYPGHVNVKKLIPRICFTFSFSLTSFGLQMMVFILHVTKV